MAKVKFKNWLMSVEKWARVTRACLDGDQEELDRAIAYMECGYCKQDGDRYKASDGGTYAQCSGCDLNKKGLCGEGSEPDAPYWRVEDPDKKYTIRQKLYAAKEVFRAIMADCPEQLKPPPSDGWD
jgi:hypothetical protein